MGTGSFPGVKYGRGVRLTTHPLLVLRSWKSRAIPLLSLRAFVAYEKGETYLPETMVNYYCVGFTDIFITQKLSHINSKHNRHI
jgi:hypothetical protein